MRQVSPSACRTHPRRAECYGLHPRHGCPPARLHDRCRRLPGRHHPHHSLGRLHPLRARHRLFLAGAAGGAADDLVLFLSAAICYREYLHIGVGVLPNALYGRTRAWCSAGSIEMLMARHQPLHALLGRRLVHDLVPEHRRLPGLIRPGISYLPVPIGGAIIVLFVIERLWRGTLFPEPRSTARSAASRSNSGDRLRWTSSSSSAASRLLPARHAGRLCARPRRDLRGAVDRPAARSGDAQRSPTAPTISRSSPFPSSSSPAPSWARAAWPSGWSISPRSSSASSAAGWRWSTSSPRPSSAASPARRSPTPPRSAR